MKITMNRSVPGSLDGIRVTDYVAGVEYDLTASPGARSLAAALVAAGMAVEVTAKPVEAKAIEPEVEALSAEVAQVESEAKPQAKPGKRK